MPNDEVSPTVASLIEQIMAAIIEAEAASRAAFQAAATSATAESVSAEKNKRVSELESALQLRIWKEATTTLSAKSEQAAS